MENKVIYFGIACLKTGEINSRLALPCRPKVDKACILQVSSQVALLRWEREKEMGIWGIPTSLAELYFATLFF